MKPAIIVLLVCTLVACKKKDDPAPQQSTTTGSTTGSTTGPTGPVVATTYDGYLTVINSMMSVAGTDYTVSYPRAYFASKKTYELDGTNGVYGGTIRFNGDSLTYNDQVKFYSLSNAVTNALAIPATWSVSGSAAVPSFSYSSKVPAPTVSGIFFPDTIVKSKGTTIRVMGVTAQSGTLVIASGSSLPIVKTIASGDNVFNLSSAQLSTIGTGTNGILSLIIENYAGFKPSFSTSGQTFKVSQQLQSLKFIDVKD